jgi:hypothetical protein
MMAICGAFFVTSSIHGKCSRLMLLRRRRSAASDGLVSGGSALQASYCFFHSPSAQLYAKRAVPAARAR